MGIRDYRGIEGYRQMIRELRESVAREFPENQGNVYIMDMVASRGEQLRAAAQEFGFGSVNEMLAAMPTGLEDRGNIRNADSNFAGVAVPLRRPDGSVAWICFGTHRDNIMRMDRETPGGLNADQITNLAWHTLHETGHALQIGNTAFDPDVLIRYNIEESGDERADQLAYDRSDMQNRINRVYHESFAEVFAPLVLVEGGIWPESLISSRAADYDERKNFQEQDNYDPGEELINVMRQGVHVNPVQSYAELPLRATFDRATGAMSDQLTINEQTLRAYTEEDALGFVRLQLTNSELTEYLGENRFTAPAMNEEQIMQWYRDRADVFNDASLVVSAEQHRLGNPERYNPTLPDSTLDQALGNALRHYQESMQAGNDRVVAADRSVAQAFLINVSRMDELGLRSADGIDHDNHALLNAILDNPHVGEWAQRLASGESFNSVAHDMVEEVQVPDVPDHSVTQRQR